MGPLSIATLLDPPVPPAPKPVRVPLAAPLPVPRPAAPRPETPPPKAAPLAPARPSQPGRPGVVARQSARSGESESRPDGADQSRSDPDLPAWLDLPGHAGGQGGQGGGDDDEGDGQTQADGAVTGAAGGDDDGEAECAALLKAMPTGPDSGIFELMLPGGERLGVALDINARLASFLLSPSSERLRAQIKKRKMELENSLAQRMDICVRLVLL